MLVVSRIFNRIFFLLLRTNVCFGLTKFFLLIFFSLLSALFSACTPGSYNDQTKQTSCKNCASGRYTALPALFFCSTCKEGRYQNEEGIASCLPCVPGEYNDQRAVTACKMCAANNFGIEVARKKPCEQCAEGRTSLEGSVKCSACAAGKYIGDASKCVQCPQGYYQPAQDQESCLLCGTKERSETSDVGAASCVSCDLGKKGGAPGFCIDCTAGKCVGSSCCFFTGCLTFFLTMACSRFVSFFLYFYLSFTFLFFRYQDGKGERSCKDCATDSYGTESARSSGADCNKCPDFTTTGGTSGQTSLIACVCDEGYYLSDGQVHCVACPKESTNCSGKVGLTLATLPSAKGWFRESNNTASFFACDPPKDCQGGNTSEQCVEGHTGVLCAVCRENLVRQSGVCTPCSPNIIPDGTTGLATIATVPPFLMFLCLLCYFGKNEEEEEESFERKKEEKNSKQPKTMTLNMKTAKVAPVLLVSNDPSNTMESDYQTTMANESPPPPPPRPPPPPPPRPPL